jgi:hypothetical protein
MKTISDTDKKYIEKRFDPNYGYETEMAKWVEAVLQIEGMPSIDEVAKVTKEAIDKLYDKSKDFWDQLDDVVTEYEGGTATGFMYPAYEAMGENFKYSIDDFMNMLGWISGHEGNTDQNDYHPGYFKGVEQFFEENDIDPDDGSYEQFINTTSNYFGWHTGQNKFNITPLQ